MNAPSVISIGEVLWDLFPDGPRFGGAPANLACHATALGARVSLVSAVGDDARGSEALEILVEQGVETSLVQKVPGATTGTVEVILDEKGKPTFTIAADSAWDRIAWTPELDLQIAAANAIAFGTLGQRGEVTCATTRQALSTAARYNLLRVLDVNLRAPYWDAERIRESIALANVLKLSDDELPAVVAACGVSIDDGLVMTLQRLLAKYSLNLIALTRGEDGAILVTETEVAEQPGIPTIVMSTVGAGDAFTAALTVGLLRGNALPAIARNACEIAAAVCARSSALPEFRGK